MGNIPTKADESYVLSPKEHTNYIRGWKDDVCDAVFSPPTIATQVEILHDTYPNQLTAPQHSKERLHCMKQCTDKPTHGLVLVSTRLWDGNSDFKFRMSSNSDSDYAKDSVDRRRLSGSVVMLEGSPVIFCSGTKKYVFLYETEAELYAAISTAQYML